MRTRQALKNLTSSTLATVLTLLLSFAAAPLLIKWLGEEALGAYRVLIDFWGYFLLLELGLFGALRPTFVRHSGAKSELIRYGISRYIVIAIGASFLLVCFYPFSNHVIPVSEALRDDFRVAYFLGIAAFAFIFGNTFRALLDAEQKSYLVTTATFVQNVSITIAGLSFAYFNCGITGQVLAMVLSSVAATILLWLFARKLIYHGNKPLPREVRAELQRLNLPTFINQACGRICLFTDNMIISAFFGPALVIPFFYTQRLIVIAQKQLQGIGNATWAGIAEKFHLGDDNFEEQVLKLSKATICLSITGLVPLCLINEQFIGAWLSPKQYAGHSVTIAAGLNASLLAIFSLWGSIIEGTGHAPALMRMNVIQATINLGFSLMFTYFYGIVGPLYGSLAAFLLVPSWWLPVQMKRHLGIRFGGLLVRIIAIVSIGLLAAQIVKHFPFLLYPCCLIFWLSSPFILLRPSEIRDLLRSLRRAVFTRKILPV